MPARTSHEAARTTSNLSMYNESLIPPSLRRIDEGFTELFSGPLPRCCCFALKKTATPEFHRFSLQPNRWSRLRYAPPLTRAEVNGPNALYSKDDCAQNR